MARITVARTFSGHSNAKYKAKYFKRLSALAQTTVHVFTYLRPGLYQIMCVTKCHYASVNQLLGSWKTQQTPSPITWRVYHRTRGTCLEWWFHIPMARQSAPGQPCSLQKTVSTHTPTCTH